MNLESVGAEVAPEDQEAWKQTGSLLEEVRQRSDARSCGA